MGKEGKKGLSALKKGKGKAPRSEVKCCMPSPPERRGKEGKEKKKGREGPR